MVHVTQLKVCAMLQLHVVVMEFKHDDFTQIFDGLMIDEFVYYDSDRSHLTPHQVLTEDNSRFKVRLHHPLEIHFLVCHEIDIPMLPDVLHCLPEH